MNIMYEKCPQCGSSDLVLTNGSYSTGCGCLGLLLFGWIGLLLGLLGFGNYELVCKHCGARWPVGKPHKARQGTGCGIFLLLLILIILIASLGCQSRPAIDGAWQLKTNNPRIPITLIIEKDGSFYGFSGVNRYFGKLLLPLDNGKFQIIGTPGITMMSGPELDKEQDYIKMLTTADKWQINSSNELELFCKGKKTAVFEYNIKIKPKK